MAYSFFGIFSNNKYILREIEQLILAGCVSLNVTTIVGLAVPTVPASPIRTTTPHLYVRLPEYREPSLLNRLLEVAEILVEEPSENVIEFGLSVSRWQRHIEPRV